MKSFFSIPRIISVVLFAIILFSSLARGFAFKEIFITLIAGIIFFAPKDYTNKQFDLFIHSLKLNKNYLLVVLFDTLFFFTVFISAYGISYALSSKTAIVAQALELYKTASDPSSLDKMASLLNLFWFYFASAIIVFAAVSLAGYSLFKSLGWSVILRKKFTRHLFLKFLAGNTLWWLVWLLPALIFIFALKPELTAYVYLIMFFLYFHTTTIVHFFIAKTLEIKPSIANAFSVGFGSIHHFIIPYAFAFIIYFILLQPFSYATFMYPSIKQVSVASFVFVIFYMAWFKIYLAGVIGEIKH